MTNDSNRLFSFDLPKTKELIQEIYRKKADYVMIQEHALGKSYCIERFETIRRNNDPDTPREFISLARLLEMETGQLIVAIRNTTCHFLQEAEEEAGTVGKPPIMDMEISGWCFQIIGNPDVVADWLKGHGFHAAIAVKNAEHNKCFLYPETISSWISNSPWNARRLMTKKKKKGRPEIKKERMDV